MAGLLVLAACSVQGGHGGAGGAPISTSGLPQVKAGYWERTVTQNGAAAQVSHVCNQGQALQFDGVDRNCSSFSMGRTLTGAVEVSATCATGPVSSTLHETISGDFNASYASDSQLTITLQGQPPHTLTTHVAMRYVGACPPAPPPGGPSDAG